MTEPNSQPDHILGMLLPLAENNESRLLEGAFLGLRKRWQRPCPELQVSVLESIVLKNSAGPLALAGNGSTTHVLTRKGGGTWVAGLGSPLAVELPKFLPNGYGVCQQGNQLVLLDGAEPRIAIIQPETRTSRIHVIHVEGMESSSLRAGGICAGPEGFYMTATDGANSHILRIAPLGEETDVVAEVMHTTRTAEAIRYFNNRFHVLEYHPVPMLVIYQPHSGGTLHPVGHLALSGYPIDVLPFGDGLIVTGYGSVLRLGADYSIRARYNLAQSLGLAHGSYVLAAPADSGHPEHIWLCASQGHTVYKLALS